MNFELILLDKYLEGSAAGLLVRYNPICFNSWWSWRWPRNPPMKTKEVTRTLS